MNQINLIGHTGQEPQMKFMPDGTPVTNFSLAVNRRFTDPATGVLMEETLWFDVACWRRLAETVAENVGKGRQARVSGRLESPRIFTDRNGAQRVGLRVYATEVEFLGSRPQAAETGIEGKDGATQPAPSGSAGMQRKVAAPNIRPVVRPGRPQPVPQPVQQAQPVMQKVVTAAVAPVTAGPVLTESEDGLTPVGF